MNYGYPKIHFWISKNRAEFSDNHNSLFDINKKKQKSC